MPASSTKTLQAGFGLSLLILVLSTVASYVSIKGLISNARLVGHTSKVMEELESVISSAKDAETGHRGYLLSGDTSFLQPYHSAYLHTSRSLDTVGSLTRDDPAQQADLVKLRSILSERYKIIRRSIESKLVDIEQLRRGKDFMDEARVYVTRMQNRERDLLKSRTGKMDRFSTVTPILIIVAAILAVLSTFYFYKKVTDNFTVRTRLAEQLRKKDAEITTRIEIIREIANQISKGDYKLRLDEAQSDGLGSLAGSLNKMAISLDRSFTLLSEKEWQQAGMVELSETLAGEKDLETLTSDAISFYCTYLQAQIGSIYVVQDEVLELKGTFSYKPGSVRKQISYGQGLLGQVAIDRKTTVIHNIDDNDFQLLLPGGHVKPKYVVAVPVQYNHTLRGIIEIGSMEPFQDKALEFLNRSAENLAVAIYTSVNRTRLQELLEETQAQSEELQAQHSELENLNTELEAQAEKLQASEEELKVQQEELLEANQELQERSALLEEKNQMVVARNLEIQKKSEELALNARYKSEFLANMSHELRTPLNSILLLSRLLGENNENNLKQEQVEYARVIQSSGNSLLLLIDDILDLSKIESGKMQLEYHPVSLEEVVNETRMLFEPLAKEKNIAFSAFIEPGVTTGIETDRMRLEQIIKNLLSNAIKFTSEGEVSLSVKTAKPGYISICVRDTGIGIPADKQQLIFEAFQQADGSTRRKFGGTGLGLSISKQLAVLLNGNIDLESEPGKGSLFTLTIPVSQAVAVEEKSKEQILEELPEEPVEVPESSDGEFLVTHIPQDIPDDRDEIGPNDKVILIVEDDTSFATALLDFTRKKGYKGVVAVRGDLGIEMANRYHPVGILLDIVLPVRNGWEVMEELKRNKATRHIPVHVMSSLEAKRQSLMSGAIDFINKPMAYEQMDTIFQRIEHYLKKDSRKVLIIEDNSKHAEALAFFLGSNQVNSVISDSINAGLDSLENKEVDCVILDMGIPDIKAYEALEAMKESRGMENTPVIIFTGKSLSRNEEMKIRRYADSIVVKTAHSYRRILDEVSLFLHLVEENKKTNGEGAMRKNSLSGILKDRKVLIADDDVRNIFSLTKALEQHQMQVVAAVDGREALAMLERHPDTDLVLMDMMMPEMDGYETIAKIRSNAAWKYLPIISVTAKAMTGDREKCIQAGASDYISKPVDLDQLVSLLRIWLYDVSNKNR